MIPTRAKRREAKTQTFHGGVLCKLALVVILANSGDMYNCN